MDMGCKGTSSSQGTWLLAGIKDEEHRFQTRNFPFLFKLVSALERWGEADKTNKHVVLCMKKDRHRGYVGLKVARELSNAEISKLSVTVLGVAVSFRRLSGGHAELPGFESDKDEGDDQDEDDAAGKPKRQRSTDARPGEQDQKRSRGSTSSWRTASRTACGAGAKS